MTADNTGPEKHCGHERLCFKYISGFKLRDKAACPMGSDCFDKCPDDTRQRKGVEGEHPPLCTQNHHNDDGTLIVYLGECKPCYTCPERMPCFERFLSWRNARNEKKQAQPQDAQPEQPNREINLVDVYVYEAGIEEGKRQAAKAQPQDAAAGKAKTAQFNTAIRWEKIRRPKYDKAKGYGCSIELGYIGDIPIAEVSSWHAMKDHKKNPFNVHVFLPFYTPHRTYCCVEDEGQYREAATKEEIHKKAQKIVDRWFVKLFNGTTPASPGKAGDVLADEDMISMPRWLFEWLTKERKPTGWEPTEKETKIEKALRQVQH